MHLFHGGSNVDPGSRRGKWVSLARSLSLFLFFSLSWSKQECWVNGFVYFFCKETIHTVVQACMIGLLWILINFDRPSNWILKRMILLVGLWCLESWTKWKTRVIQHLLYTRRMWVELLAPFHTEYGFWVKERFSIGSVKVDWSQRVHKYRNHSKSHMMVGWSKWRFLLNYIDSFSLTPIQIHCTGNPTTGQFFKSWGLLAINEEIKMIKWASYFINKQVPAKWRETPTHPQLGLMWAPHHVHWIIPWS